MKKIVKIAAIGLPMLVLVPLATLSTSRTEVKKINRERIVKSYDYNYTCVVSAKSVFRSDKIVALVQAKHGTWKDGTYECDVELDIITDDGQEHDGGWDSWVCLFSVSFNNPSVKISSMNKKAYFEFTVKRENIIPNETDPLFLQIDTRTAYSTLTNTDFIDLGRR